MAVEVKIVIDEAGAVGVSGPLDQPLLVYGMLVAGFIALIKHYDNSQKLVQPAPPGMFLKS